MTMTYKILLIFALLPSICFAGINDKNHGNITLSTKAITSIYDGDSFRITIPQWPSIVGERIPIRVNGVDTPELRSSCETDREKTLGLKAKQLTVKMLRNGKTIELRNIKRGKYFRIVADVFVDGISLAQALIDANLGYKYHGGKKRSWC